MFVSEDSSAKKTASGKREEKKNRNRKRGGNVLKRKMRRYIPKGYIDTLLLQVNIVEVIREYLPSLCRRYANRDDEWLCLCPFHVERRASFTVTSRRSFFHCFGCGAHGSVLTFLRMYVRLSFFDAIMALARRTDFYPNMWRGSNSFQINLSSISCKSCSASFESFDSGCDRDDISIIPL